MKKSLYKIIGSVIFVISLIAMSSMSVFAATSQDYFEFGESLGPFLLIGIVVLIVWFVKKRK